MYDFIIIGGGPAGMTAAVYAARKQMKVLLLTKEFGGQPMWTRDIENYMGYQYISGPELMAKFEAQVRQFPIEIKTEEVIQFTLNEHKYFCFKTNAAEYIGKTAVIASGKRPRLLGIPGEEKLTGRGVSYCATCDGPLFKGKQVAVIGGGNSGVQAALELAGIASKVYLIARSGYRADQIVVNKVANFSNIEPLLSHSPQEIYGDEVVEKITVTDNNRNIKELAVDGVFVEIGLEPNSEFAGNLVELNEYGEVIVDCRAKTNIPGLFAAGDVNSGPDKQIVIAAGEGAKAAISAYEYLLRM